MSPIAGTPVGGAGGAINVEFCPTKPAAAALAKTPRGNEGGGTAARVGGGAGAGVSARGAGVSGAAEEHTLMEEEGSEPLKESPVTERSSEWGDCWGESSSRLHLLAAEEGGEGKLEIVTRIGRDDFTNTIGV